MRSQWCEENTVTDMDWPSYCIHLAQVASWGWDPGVRDVTRGASPCTPQVTPVTFLLVTHDIRTLRRQQQYATDPHDVLYIWHKYHYIQYKLGMEIFIARSQRYFFIYYEPEYKDTVHISTTRRYPGYMNRVHAAFLPYLILFHFLK